MNPNRRDAKSRDFFLEVKKMDGKTLSRRSFLAKSALFAPLTIVPRHVLGGVGHTPPSEKLNIAGVGIGGQGASDLRHLASQNIVALCDVDWGKAKRTFGAYPQASRYRDYRVMLDKQKDIEAVVVATPDHTHAIISMEAIRHGKHVYTEKPLTHTVHEAQTLAAAARKAGVATQMGNQGQAGESSRRLREAIWAGAIGPVREVHVWTDRPNRGLVDVYWPQGVDRPKETPTVPGKLDWDLFLGPAPTRPYHPAYHPFKWRGWWDFGTGALGDIGCHSLDPVFRALKLGYPTSVQAVSTLVNKETYPSGSVVTYKFPARQDMPKLTLTWYDGGLKPPRPHELDDGLRLGAGGTLFVGDKGKILNNRILPDSRRKEFNAPDPHIEASPGHYQEWINAAKGGAPAGSNFDWAGALTEVILMGNVALRLDLREKLDRHALQWDAKARRFSNVPEANEFLHVPYREGWTL